MRLKNFKLVATLLGCALVLGAADRNEAPHAVVAGTVFRENGFSLPGATVALDREGCDQEIEETPNGV